MYPTLSDYILGQMSVKQQPKANYRSRYACDGARFLPESRYNPLSVNVNFPHNTKFIVYHCFSFL